MRLVASILVMVAMVSSGCLQGFFPAQQEIPEFLSEAKTHWTIEVDYAQGYLPPGTVFAFLSDKLESVTDKSRVSFEIDDEFAAGTAPSGFEETVSFAKSMRGLKPDRDTVVTQILITDAGSIEGDNGTALAYALGRDLIVVYADFIREQCSSYATGTPLSTVIPNRCDETEVLKAVILHEFGHILGLVNSGLPMVRPHNDPDHPTHSNNPESVMYWALETDALLGTLSKIQEGQPQSALDRLQYNVPLSFDADDLADLCAGGSKNACNATPSD